MARKGGSGISLAKGGFTSAEKGSEGQSKSGLGGSLGGSVTVADYGDVEIKGVVDIDISPLRGDISYDTSTNELGVSGGIKIPGGVVGVGGGVVVDLDTGEISGGSVSLGIGGADVQVSVSKCEQTLQVTYFGVGFAVSKDTCNNDDDDDDDGIGEEDQEIRNDPNLSLPPPRSFSIPPGYVGWVCPMYFKTQTIRGFWVFVRTIMIDGIEYDDYQYDAIASYSTSKTGLAPVGTYYDMTYEERGQSKSFGMTGFPNFFGGSATGIRVLKGAKPPMAFKGNAQGYDQGAPSLTWGYVFYYDRYLSTTSGFPRYSYGGFRDQACFAITEPYVDKNRRPIPPSFKDKTMSECCDASISLMRKIAKVLAVDEMLAPMQTSGKILKELEKGIDAVLAEPDLVIQMDNYLELNTFLALLSNRKVALAVGVDELEFEKDQKDPKFHYLRWLKEYNEGKTPLDYQAWLKGKNKEEGLKASTTQFKSIPQLILAELYNSKTTVDVLRAHDIMKKGMQIPNELFVPGGVGFTEVYDYPGIFKKLIQILDLSTIQPFTAILQDSDPSKEGDQTLTRYYPDATSAVKEIVELLLENKVDGATRLNILMRQSILNTQQQVALLETLSIAYTIMYGLGLPFHQKGSHFVAPFDISPNTDGTTDKAKSTKKKGFNPNNKKENDKVQSAIDALNENSENSTEKLLPDFLSTIRQEYLHTYFDDKKESLWYYIMSVFMKT